MRRHVFLVGFMGAGKSTVGRIVADRLAVPMLDTDVMVSAEAGRSIATVFADEGEAGFRARETLALQRAVAGPVSVIACGGGIVALPENREVLAASGDVVYLKVTADEAVDRISDPSTRPLLTREDPKAAAADLLARREALYASVADITVDTSGLSPKAVADVIVRMLEGSAV